MCKPPGYFLVRVGESRNGFTLSYRYVFSVLVPLLTNLYNLMKYMVLLHLFLFFITFM